MLRESTVVYSSLPQEEGVESTGSVVTTLPPSSNENLHSRRDCQLTVLLLTLTLLFGITLAVIMPLAIRNTTDDSHRVKIGGGGPDNSSTDEAKAYFTGSADNQGKPVEENNNTKSVENGDAGQAQNNTALDTTPEYYQTTEKPLVTTTLATMITTSTTSVPNITAPNISIIITVHNLTIPNTTVAAAVATTPKPSVEIYPGENKSVQVTTHSPEELEELWPVTHPWVTEDYGNNDIKEDILNGIYGKEEHVKPSTTQGLSGWMNQMLLDHDQSTLIALVVLVALAGAAILTCLAWFIYNRVTARRRRLNIQNVITDLQSRDKIVLLNSEESDDE